jgi:hypothetical protein
LTDEEVLVAKPLADPDAKWVHGDERDMVHFIRMAYNSLKRS